LTIAVAGDSYTLPLPLTALNQTETALNPHESDVVVDTAEGLRIVFHLREYDTSVKVDVIALRDVQLDLKRGTVNKLEKAGKWGWDWGPLFDKISCGGGKCTLSMRAGEEIDPWIYYDSASGTYVMDSQSDYVPVAYSPSATLKDPSGWWSGNLLPSYVVASKCWYSVSGGVHNFTFDVLPNSGVAVVPVEIHVPDGGILALVRFYNFTGGSWIAASPSYQFGLTAKAARGSQAAWMWKPSAWNIANLNQTSAADGTLYRQIIAFNYTWLLERKAVSGDGRVRLNVLVYAPLPEQGDGKKTVALTVQAANNDLVLLHYRDLFLDGVDDYVRVEPFTVYGWSEITIAERVYAFHPKANMMYSRSGMIGDNSIDYPSTLLTAGSGFSYDYLVAAWVTRGADGALQGYGFFWSSFKNQWVHLVRRFSGDRVFGVWINGEKKYAVNVPADAKTVLEWNPDTATYPERYKRFVLGANTAFGDRMTCVYGEVRVYSRALSDMEVLQDYRRAASGGGLALHLDPSYWNGTHLIDLSGNGKHGRIYGNAQRVASSQPYLYRVTGKYGDGKLRALLPSEIAASAALTVKDANGNAVWTGTPAGNLTTVSCPTSTCTVTVSIDKRALGNVVTYVLSQPAPSYAPHLFVNLVPGGVNVAPKIPPPNTTLTLTHPITGTQLTITYVSYGTDMPVCVEVNGTQIPTAVIPTQYLQKSLSVRVVTATETMKAVIKSVQGGNLTFARWEGGERGGRLIFRVEAPSGAWIYTFIVSGDRPSIVFIDNAMYPYAMDLDSLLSGSVPGWAYSGNTVVVKAQAHSPVDVVVDYSGASVISSLNTAIGSLGSAVTTLAAAIVIAAAAALLKVLLGGSFDPAGFAKTVLVVAILMAAAIIAVQVVFWVANP